MLDKQKYSEYIKRKKNEKTSEQRLRIFDVLVKTIAQNKTISISNFSEKDIGDFVKSFEWSQVEVRNVFDFLADYVSFIQKEQPELTPLADVINGYCLKRFEAAAIEAASSRKKAILLIPDKAIIGSKHLGNLTNDQFVSAFRELQKLVIEIYDDIEKSPFEWGYPDYYETDGYYNRVIDILFALVFCGKYENGTLTVDGKKFFRSVLKP